MERLLRSVILLAGSFGMVAGAAAGTEADYQALRSWCVQRTANHDNAAWQAANNPQRYFHFHHYCFAMQWENKLISAANQKDRVAAVGRKRPQRRDFQAVRVDGLVASLIAGRALPAVGRVNARGDDLQPRRFKAGVLQASEALLIKRDQHIRRAQFFKAFGAVWRGRRPAGVRPAYLRPGQPAFGPQTGGQKVVGVDHCKIMNAPGLV